MLGIRITKETRCSNIKFYEDGVRDADSGPIRQETAP